jgi:hypothetical protein
LNAQCTVKQKQNQRHFQNHHWISAFELAAEAPDEISNSFSMGIALPKCGKSSSAWDSDRLGRASIGIGTASSGIGRTALS